MAETIITTEELDDLLKAINVFYGYDFTEYSPLSVKRRIVYFMDVHKIATLATLKEKLLKDKDLFGEFICEIPVTVTEMFRDPLFYKSLRENVIKRLATYPVIKIWIAGCATGEEAFSIAIILKEEGLLKRSTIYATDINKRSLLIAKQGSYPIQTMQLYTTNYMQAGGKAAFSTYYTIKYATAIFNSSLKENIVFSTHNLVTDKSFNEFQLIICRNVLIYFNQALQNKVIHLFYDSLCTFGILALGNKESLLFTDKRSQFDELDKKEKIFMKSGK